MILEGEINVNNKLLEDLNASDIACMKHAPIIVLLTSIEVFQSIKIVHIKKLLIIQCNKVKYEFNFCFRFLLMRVNIFID